MAQYYTSFVEGWEGWTHHHSNSSYPAPVYSRTGGYTDGYALELGNRWYQTSAVRPGGFVYYDNWSQSTLTSDTVGVVEDVEVVTRFRPSASLASYRPVGVRLNASLSGYYLIVGRNTGVLSTTGGSVDTGYTFPSGSWSWVRLRAEGTTISAKAWPDGQPEPEDWQLQVSNSSHTSGHVAINGRQSPNGADNNCNYIFDVLGVGTDGDTAPTEPLPTGHDASLAGASSIVPLTASGSLFTTTPSISGTLEVQGRAATSGTMYVASTESGLIVKTASVAPDGSFVVDNLDRHTTYRVWGTTDVNGKTYTTQVCVMEAD